MPAIWASPDTVAVRAPQASRRGRRRIGGHDAAGALTHANAAHDPAGPAILCQPENRDRMQLEKLQQQARKRNIEIITIAMRGRGGNAVEEVVAHVGRANALSAQE